MSNRDEVLRSYSTRLLSYEYPKVPNVVFRAPLYMAMAVAVWGSQVTDRFLP